jgi:small-conductance mechanosensitive channel
MYRGVINDNAAFLHYFFNVTKTQRVCHVPSHTKHHDFQRIMQSFKNLAEGTFDEAFAKIVHTKLYQIRLLRHNRLQCIISTMTVPGTEALHNERDKTMNPIVYAIPVFMLTILLEAWVARRRGVAVYDIPDAITSLHHGLLSQVTNAFTKIATLGIYIAVYEAYRFTEWSMSSIPLWILALVLYDLCYYWAHRMGHEVNVMWASHVVHHSSEYYNLSTALRQTSTGALFGWVFYLPWRCSVSRGRCW